jgi:hypothetical protein
MQPKEQRMPRVKAIHRPADYPGKPDEETQEEVAALFQQLFPGVEDPRIDENHVGMAIAAHNPQLAMGLGKLSSLIAVDLPWCQRRDLRELAIQAVNLHFNAHYAFEARRANAKAAGIGPELLDALPDWKKSPLFDVEQRLVIEYAHAVASGEVPATLSKRVIGLYGEKGAVEFTSLVAFWSFWALFLNATGAGE